MRLLHCLLGCCLAGTGFAAPTGCRFDFGSGPVADGCQPVRADTAYTAARGFGFEAGAAVVDLDRGGDALCGDSCTSERPFFFSVDLPEGNYRAMIPWSPIRPPFTALSF